MPFLIWVCKNQIVGQKSLKRFPQFMSEDVSNLLKDSRISELNSKFELSKEMQALSHEYMAAANIFLNDCCKLYGFSLRVCTETLGPLLYISPDALESLYIESKDQT